MKPRLYRSLLPFLLVLAAQVASRQAVAPAQAKLPESLPADEFSRLSRELSEDGGFFPSDNFTSNETSSLTITDKLRQLNATGGACIGVGPEQNFTCISWMCPLMQMGRNRDSVLYVSYGNGALSKRHL
jgi:hypothetical protein